ncbi:peptide chain release factor N(5)-glutamine methyltransferase [Pediococcus argentinicus]|uniref:Release factor glutamine methyltransferase n=1 Tax=Pediococcus argentinicus TaxID=480391 RepID=A0A0R2NAG9_9LACO|nr:peptide chain release factor N(5)-glutamine methyltransferase [Pediococcus argentinicus]KRO22820.1 prmC protein [Pediococcus argentinicus]NKZ22991.1 peptide chain release factor N(5)-glutamine methyltransferase [Pediococcus argentinicus]GEP20062.1 release factor glutamine methyltransferase [Pediococcus argentinicus]
MSSNLPTYFEALKWASLFIQNNSKNVDPDSAQLLMMDEYQWSHSELVLNYRAQMTSSRWQQFQKMVQSVALGRPAQYVTKIANFFGREFYVDERVLIPRMETEELVEQVLSLKSDLPNNANVLDLGTGSGDIALTLKLEQPEWSVTGTDLSNDALDIAKINRQHFGVDVTLRQGSMFEALDESKMNKFDVIVSNPPYIAEDERSDMDQSVLDYEPDMALFAEDQGLFWYKEIGKHLKEYLNVGGYLLCEIGFRQGPALKEWFQSQFPDANTEIIKDITEHDRILKVQMR